MLCASHESGKPLLSLSSLAAMIHEECYQILCQPHRKSEDKLHECIEDHSQENVEASNISKH